MSSCLADGRQLLTSRRAPAPPDSTAEVMTRGLDPLPRAWAEAREPRLQNPPALHRRRARGLGRSVLQADSPVEAARGMDVQHSHRGRPLVMEGMLDARRDEHERSRWGRDVLTLDREDHLALEDVEGVVLLLVDVGLEHAPGGDLDDREVEARGIRGPREELDVPDALALAGRDDYGAVAHAGRRERPENSPPTAMPAAAADPSQGPTFRVTSATTTAWGGTT